jgi:nucleoside recognition membrane protein YjiH
MYISNIVVIVVIVILIVTVNLIMKSKKSKKTTEYYENVIAETPYPELNNLMGKFNKIYEKNINSKIGLKNFLKNYY